MKRRICNQCDEPRLDENAIDCDGQYFPAGCVILDKNTYLEIQEGDRLTDLLSVLTLRFKAISRALNRKLDVTSLYEEGNFYVDDAAAALGGVGIGEVYINTDGFLKVRMI